MDIQMDDVKNFTEIAKPIIDPLVSTFIKPNIYKINEWLKAKGKKQKVEDNYWENKFSTYLNRLYKDSFYLTTLVFPNSQTKIKDLYIPLTIVKSSDYDKIKIDDFNFEIFDNYSKIIISDYAGMGKSTLLKWITLSIIEKNESIPILVELRKINSQNSVIDEILNQLNTIDKTIDTELFYELLKLGFFTILFDGFDEIPYDIQSEVTIQLNDFIKKTDKNNFILTSRPESALSTFSNFQLFYINPLEEKEAFQLIEKLDKLSKVKLGDKLIDEIKEKNTQVQEFLTNPFLVSLLYKSYTYNKDIPSKKITFYEEVYSCLYKHHDLSKEGFKRPKRSRLDIYDFEIILREIAFETAKKGVVIYTKDELLKHIFAAKIKNPNIDFKEINFFEDLTTTVPLFTIEGNNIKWAHKSIQDFFAAKYISNHPKKEEIMGVIYNSNKFHFLNILDLLYELEYKIFRKKIIVPIVEEFVDFYDANFKPSKEINNELIKERISLLFGTSFCILKLKQDIGFDSARNLFTQNLKKDEYVMTGSTFHHTFPPYYSMNSITLKKEISKILKIKNEDLFFLRNKQYQYISTEDALEMFEFNFPYIVNFHEDEPYNKNEKIYYWTNKLIADRLRDRKDRKNTFFNFDYDKCKIKLEKISREIEIDSQDDFLENI